MTFARELPGREFLPLGPWPGEHVRVGPFRLYARHVPDTTGTEPAVYVHGLGGAATNWTDLQYLLADRLDGHAIDLPGFGHSDPPPGGDYRLDTHVRAVTAYVEDVVGAPVHLFGNSMGGAVALRLAAERPDLVQTLTLVAPALPDLRPRVPGDPRLLALFVPGVDRLLAHRLGIDTVSRRARATLELVYADPARIHPERLAQAEQEVVRRTGLDWSARALVRSGRGIVSTYLSRGERSLWQQATRVQAPTLLVFGRQDRLVDVSLAARARRAIPSARLLVLDDCGHVAQMEHPQVVADAVRELLDAGSPTT